MPTKAEKIWMAETGGDRTAEQVQAALTHAAIEYAITLTVNLLDALKQAEFESGKEVDFNRFVYNPFTQTPRGWLKSLHQYLLTIQQEYEEAEEDA